MVVVLDICGNTGKQLLSGRTLSTEGETFRWQTEWPYPWLGGWRDNQSGAKREVLAGLRGSRAAARLPPRAIPAFPGLRRRRACRALSVRSGGPVTLAVDREQRLLGAISCWGPAARGEPERFAALGTLVRDAARSLVAV